jgi:hypothetical protein
LKGFISTAPHRACFDMHDLLQDIERVHRSTSKSSHQATSNTFN